MIVKFELTLNREWIYEDEEHNNDPIGENNFVIENEYFIKIFKELFPKENDVEDFLDVYCPETDGEKMYQRALKDNKIIDEFRTTYEEKNNL